MTYPEPRITPLEESAGYETHKAGVPYNGDPADILADGEIQIGARIRDAAVDPQPEDFLAPVNAGKADPHGPDVRAIEVDSSLWEAHVAKNRKEHPEMHAPIVPKDDPGAGSVVDASYLAELNANNND
ncbi:hypothetical protein [Williamsia sp. DF01-3]|uniref:hypothetical protein n=1 Tax=Williamsia sp. DF01-3 TaxID=2934157 RepID=UPI001FF63C8D|nr:hypothetical protein [Williamsia sp. DF01-3]MCK0516973.1 hypothetical protein [Williamsia sp. DF01-3]